MGDSQVSDLERYQLSNQHYEFVENQWVAYYKLYMQSWNIFGAAILVGAVFSSKMKFADIRNNELSLILFSLIPFIILIWFLLVSYFWAMLAMYSEYLKTVEENIHAISTKLGISTHMLHTNYRNRWFQGFKNIQGKNILRKDGLVVILLLCLCSIVYIAIAIMAYLSVADSSEFMAAVLIIFYIIGAILSPYAAMILIKGENPKKAIGT